MAGGGGGGLGSCLIACSTNGDKNTLCSAGQRFLFPSAIVGKEHSKRGVGAKREKKNVHTCSCRCNIAKISLITCSRAAGSASRQPNAETKTTSYFKHCFGKNQEAPRKLFTVSSLMFYSKTFFSGVMGTLRCAAFHSAKEQRIMGIQPKHTGLRAVIQTANRALTSAMKLQMV